ncbi:MarR family transcriptional regulator [Shewanella sp. AS16]|uniref:MarR family winged helix-turn-helix transcriptional regulator n=1 Tax=Shewanella sp. AS16 TaxID=2907625 RepID=UPI001F40D248|nr:MarR family transcriptional regulator [Shewanella sp. AS16]MCE9686602.1 MarR family transcriptional regulator [Shewanella sp. AS16]
MQKNGQLLLDNQLCFALYSSSLAMTQLYKPLLDAVGLTYTQYLVMLVLWEADAISLKEIAARLGQQSGALTPVIKRLEADGLVLRVRSAEDERQLNIQLTDKGQDLRQAAKQINLCIAEQCGLAIPDVIDLKVKLNLLRDKLQKSAK